MNPVAPSGEFFSSCEASRRQFLLAAMTTAAAVRVLGTDGEAGGPAHAVPVLDRRKMAALVGEWFEVLHPSGKVARLRLKRLLDCPSPPGSGITSFAAVFEGRAPFGSGDALMSVTHPAVGTLPLLLQDSPGLARPRCRLVAVMSRWDEPVHPHA